MQDGVEIVLAARYAPDTMHAIATTTSHVTLAVAPSRQRLDARNSTQQSTRDVC